MGKMGISWQEVHDRWMENPEYAKEYEKLKPEYERIRRILEDRQALHSIQEESDHNDQN